MQKQLTHINQSNASIICIGSSNSKAAEKNSVVYDTSKGAIIDDDKISCNITLAEKNIRVNGIGPGISRNTFNKKRLR